MGSLALLSCLLPLSSALLLTVFNFHISIKAESMESFACSGSSIEICNASLYHVNRGEQVDQLASSYNSTHITNFSHGDRQDYLVTVPCSCQNVNGTVGYFYDISYKVKLGDTFVNVSASIYNGQAWMVGDEQKKFIAGKEVTLYLLCGCVQSDSKVVVTYTVQQHDTLSDIATTLSATMDGIKNMNSILGPNSSFIDVGWVLFVPMELNGIPAPASPKKGRRQKWTIILGILLGVTLLLMTAMMILFVRSNRSRQRSEKETKAVTKSMSITTRAHSLQRLYTGSLEEGAAFESDGPVIYGLEEIEEATYNFDETKKVGEGGYGSVYFGVLRGKEVAIKKMRSNKSKEFFAELKVLCKIHHINVVELQGYASGADHFYLVYEYVQNGSLSDHLHDPLLKGYQPLSWTARAQIALDAAKGIEYIHDHTKARCVHRDIKTSNILLDKGLRAKVADFGLAKLAERTNEDDLIATQLVGTPGYLPPESVKELQVTSKTDVFAFGVVLAELITGRRALTRDSKDPTKTKSLITVVYRVLRNDDPQSALEDIIDGNLRGTFPFEDVYKMAEIAEWCLTEDPISRPEMRDIILTLSQIATSSVEWEASLGSSQDFSGIHNGR